MNTQTLPLKQIRIDGGTQPRVEINEEVVADYAEQLREGVAFPPVVVFFDGVVYWLADGFHRYHSHRRVGRDAMTTDVRDGGLRDAILYSVGANTEHGLRRTNEDKRKAVETMLTNNIVSMDEDGNPWSNRDIARQCHVDEGTVRNYRKILTAEIPQLENKNVVYTTKHGSKAVMHTANIGKTQPKKRKRYGEIAPNAFTPIREVRPMLAQTPIDLPHDVPSAARAIVHAMGREFTAKLIDALTAYLKGN
jgi:hypothetical protein